MNMRSSHGLVDNRLNATIMIVVILALTLVSALTYQGARGPSSGIEAGSISSSSITSSASHVGSNLETTTLHFVYPCNCSLDLSWAWPVYHTLNALESVSDVIVIGQVASASTVGVNISSDQFGSPFAPPKSLIPITGYNITVTKVLS